jgi:hypothetical protein
MPPVTVHKLNARGETVVSYQAKLAETFADGVRLEAAWTRPPLALGYTTFETGDQFVEWFFTDRWYNIFEIHAGDGTLKGWYCNITEPATLGVDSIAARDLILDLWVAPDGRQQVLDEDEFAADSSLDPEIRHAAQRALAELRTLAATGAYPFLLVATPKL